jgi:hypothetical protein
VSTTLNDALRMVVLEGTQLVCASHLTAHRDQFTHELVLERGRVVRAGAIVANERNGGAG